MNNTVIVLLIFLLALVYNFAIETESEINSGPKQEINEETSVEEPGYWQRPMRKDLYTSVLSHWSLPESGLQ